MTTVDADTGQRRPLGDEAIKAVERAAAEERGVAAERGALLRDLTATREHMIAEIEEVDRQLAWWQQRYPNEPAAVELGRAQERAAVQLAEAEARLAAVGREQQAHEVAAAQLAEHAVLLRAAVEAARPDEPGPDRTSPDGPGRARTAPDRVVATKGGIDTDTAPVDVPKGGAK